MSEPGAESMLKKVRKLESNRFCPNCNTESPTGLGFGNICVKYNTFVCDMCKTSHQAISHRCKSVSMSTWTLAEVNSLTAGGGGGNDVARNTWLAEAPPVGQSYAGGRRPKKGDNVEHFKQFVMDCYERKKFHAGSVVLPEEPVQRQPRNSKIAERKPTPKPPAEEDFLNFDSQQDEGSSFNAAFDSFGMQSSDSFANGNAATTSNNANFDSFENFASEPQGDSVFNFDGFGGSGSGSSAPVNTAPSQQNNTFDAFSEAQPVVKPTGDDLLDIFGATTSSSSASSSSSNSVDIFGGDELFATTPSSSTQQQQQQPAPMQSTGLQRGGTGLQGGGGGTGLQGGGMGGGGGMMMMGQGQQPRYGGGAAAISNLGGLLGGGPMGGGRPMPQRPHQSQFDFVGMSMKSQLGASQQPPQHNSMLMQGAPPAQTAGEVQSGGATGSNTGLQGGGMGGMGMGGMGMGGMGMGMGGGSSAISSMNGIVRQQQQQQQQRRGSKGFSSVNFPSAW